MADLDTILSGDGAPASEPAKEPASQETQAAEPSQAQPTEPQDPDVVDHSDGRKLVPLEALTEARGKVKRYTEQVASFEQTLKERDDAWDRRFQQLLQTVKPPQQQEPAQVPDIFENAPEAIRHTVAPQFEQMNEVLMANAKLVAGIKFTDEKVDEAEKAFITAIQSKQIDPADYHKVVGAPNRYAAAVQWHQRHLAQQEIGDDPTAYRAKVEAEILAKHGLTAPAEGGKPADQHPAPVMPSNLATARNVGARSGPAWGGPTPLADIFSR